MHITFSNSEYKQIQSSFYKVFLCPVHWYLSLSGSFWSLLEEYKQFVNNTKHTMEAFKTISSYLKASDFSFPLFSPAVARYRERKKKT